METHLRRIRHFVRPASQHSLFPTNSAGSNRHSSEYDQELDSLLVGPIPVGVNKFIFEADAPDVKRIPTSEMLGVTVILLTCSYDGREFVRVGYYVNNEYDSEELAAEPPAKPVIERIRRNVLAEKPRVTRFAIKW
jgi:histone chaperone ASF1